MMFDGFSFVTIFRVYILMKKDICPKLFLLCQISDFMCNTKSINKSKILKIKNYFTVYPEALH